MAYSLLTKLSVSAVLLCAVGGSHTLAKLTPPPPPPPPPSISNINQYGITDERLWTKDKAAEVRGEVTLTADREVRGLHIYEPDVGYSAIDLGGRTLTVGHEGISKKSYNFAYINGPGLVTSSSSRLSVNIMEASGWSLFINSVISDNRLGKVDLFVSGAHSDSQRGYLALAGSDSNTFSGDVTISGLNGLALVKKNGATAIKGNVYIKDRAVLGIYLSDQIDDSSIVTLSGADATIYLARENASEVSEKFHKLVVDKYGSLALGQGGGSNTFPHGQRHIFLDDLEITAGSILSVKEWEWGRDHILVRRDSEHLEESLKRMKFEGYDPNATHLVDYDNDYWEINALPEPAVYGAALMVGVLGLVGYRGRRKRMPFLPAYLPRCLPIQDE